MRFCDFVIPSKMVTHTQSPVCVCERNPVPSSRDKQGRMTGNQTRSQPLLEGMTLGNLGSSTWLPVGIVAEKVPMFSSFCRPSRNGGCADLPILKFVFELSRCQYVLDIGGIDVDYLAGFVALIGEADLVVFD